MKHSPLRTKLRTVSRIALYSSLTLTLGVAVVLVWLASAPFREQAHVDWNTVDFTSLEEVELLREYVRIDTSASTGNTLAGARFLADRLEEAGVPYHLERLGEKDANLWATLEGEDPNAVVLHHHIDVEDIHYPEKWGREPFGAEIDLPWVYGRGTFDMKSIGIAQLMAVIDLARSGVPLKRSVVLLATAGEEIGSHTGTRWVLREHPELVDRFGMVLTEGGVVEGWGYKEVKYWGTEFCQKRYITLVACDPSRERLEELRDDLIEFRASSPDLQIVEEVRAFLSIYGKTRQRDDYVGALTHPEEVLRDTPLFESLPGYVKAMFRNELHPFDVQPAEGGGWELPVKIHLLPGVELDDVRSELLPEWLFFGIQTTIEEEPSAKHGSPIDHPVFAAIDKALDELHPDAPAGPLFLPWTATDARFFRARGIPSYGFTPFTALTSDVIRVSGPNERIDLPGYVDGVATYKRLLRALAT